MDITKMKVKQAVKHLTLLSMIAISITGCSSTQNTEDQPTQTVIEPEPILEPMPEQPIETTSAVINNGVIDIPVIEDARVFAEFSDELPAVINYFTNSTEAEIITFYQQSFGEATSQERKRGRLTLRYQEGDEAMRVVISQQNKKRQVDVIIENN